MLYHATTAVLMTAEAAALGGKSGDARRLLLARMVADHRLSAPDPMGGGEEWEAAAIDLLLSDRPVSLAEAVRLVG